MNMDVFLLASNPHISEVKVAHIKANRVLKHIGLSHDKASITMSKRAKSTVYEDKMAYQRNVVELVNQLHEEYRLHASGVDTRNNRILYSAQGKKALMAIVALQKAICPDVTATEGTYQNVKK